MFYYVNFFGKNKFLISLVIEFQIHISKWNIILENFLHAARKCNGKDPKPHLDM